MLTLAWPWLLLCLPLPALAYWLLPPSTCPQAALKVPFFQSVSALSQDAYQSRSLFRWSVLGLLWCLLVLAATRPQWVGDTVNVPVSGRDLMLAVDVSGSMKAEDMILEGQSLDRLSAVKQVAGEFIQQRLGDRIGLILFGTRAYLQAPLTLDRKTAGALLQESAIGIAGEKTAIGDAIGLTIKRLKDRISEDKVLILMTDGSNTAGTLDPLKAAELARVAELKIHTIGVGADQMMVQDLFGSRLVNPSSDLDEKTLTAIARTTGGEYFRARDTETLSRIYQLIDQLEPVEEDTQHLRPTAELFYWPLSAAALLAVFLAITAGGLAEEIRVRVASGKQPQIVH